MLLSFELAIPCPEKYTTKSDLPLTIFLESHPLDPKSLFNSACVALLLVAILILCFLKPNVSDRYSLNTSASLYAYVASGTY